MTVNADIRVALRRVRYRHHCCHMLLSVDCLLAVRDLDCLVVWQHANREWRVGSCCDGAFDVAFSVRAPITTVTVCKLAYLGHRRRGLIGSVPCPGCCLVLRSLAQFCLRLPHLLDSSKGITFAGALQHLLMRHWGERHQKCFNWELERTAGRTEPFNILQSTLLTTTPRYWGGRGFDAIYATLVPTNDHEATAGDCFRWLLQLAPAEGRQICYGDDSELPPFDDSLPGW